MAKVSGGKGGFWMRKLSFRKPCDGEPSIFISAVLCSETGSSSSSPRGGMSERAWGEQIGGDRAEIAGD